MLVTLHAASGREGEGDGAVRKKIGEKRVRNSWKSEVHYRCIMPPFDSPSSSNRKVVLVLIPLSRDRRRRLPPPPKVGTAKGLPITAALLLLLLLSGAVDTSWFCRAAT